MKYLILLTTMLAGCGALNNMCGENLRMGCNTIFGEQPVDPSKRLSAVEQRLGALENRFEDLKLYSNLLYEEQLAVLADLNRAMAQQSLDVSKLQAQQYQLTVKADTLQQQLNSAVSQIAVLQLHEYVSEFVDPCGNGPGFDEVLLKTSSGKLVAYFESSGNRFLSVLTAGNYRTTDYQGCFFTVNSAGQILNEHL